MIDSHNAITSLIESLIPELKKTALEAGAKIMDIYASDKVKFSAKEDNSPLSDADLASHNHITNKISMLSDYPIVSEEDFKSVKRNSNGWFWLIDPLDGTKEFLNRNGEFTVNIALIGQGLSHFGLVYAPAIHLMYWGGKEFGAYRSNKEGVRKISVSKNSKLPYRVVASKSHLNNETQMFIEKFKSFNLVQYGSSLKFCRIAEGAADIYPRLAPTCEWDTAAAQAVLEGAGGYVVDIDKKPLRYGKSDIINPSFIAARDISIIP